MLVEQDELECILSKARPKFPNQPQNYESSKKLVPVQNWHHPVHQQKAQENLSIVNTPVKSQAESDGKRMSKKQKKRNKLKEKMK